ncbi:phosphatase PAP2 family protein [Bacillus wiedmannii]|uniref:phosphatase PAP2 family protein n=1 Tax=Bacillus wiedmannii TaxID=1890302 RepID=UPI0020D204C1|nr:phosphatase PAP2 family protein [Bacillus wiedmannii]
MFIYRELSFILHSIKQLVDRTANSSFPSDYATVAIVIATTLWISAFPFKYIWFLLTIVVAFSRVCVGVHYHFDVIVGIVHVILFVLFAHYVVCELLAI